MKPVELLKVDLDTAGQRFTDDLTKTSITNE